MKTATAISILFLLNLTCSKTASKQGIQVFSNHQELLSAIAEHSNLNAPSPTSEQISWANLGKDLFFDTTLSRSKKSCAHCHQPEQGFADDLGHGPMNLSTLPLSNLGQMDQYGRIGQFASLLDAVSNMLLNPLFSYFDLDHLQKKLENVAPPQGLSQRLTQLQMQQGAPSARLIARAYATLKDKELKSAFDKILSDKKLFTEQAMQKIMHPSTADQEQEDTLGNRSVVISSAAYAISTYLLNIESYQSPFDRFTSQVLKNGNIETSFNEKFSHPEWNGFLIFRKANCHRCHAGPNFSRGLTANVGTHAPATKSDSLATFLLLMGEAAADLYPYYYDYSCTQEEWRNLARSLLSKSCQRTSFPSEDTDQIGAFKTPSLRNLKLRKTLTHAGLTINLEDFMQSHGTLKAGLHAIGELSPLLSKDELDFEEKKLILSFLESLNTGS